MVTKTLVIDSMNIAYRMYFRLPKLHSLDGKETAVFYGYLRQLQHLHKKFNPKNILLTWDSRENVRKKFDPTYKQNRHKDKDENFIRFINQVKQLKVDLSKIGLMNFESVGYESDDIIALLCRKHKFILPAIICSSDSDVLQLITKDISVYTGKELIDKESFEKTWGFSPSLYILYKTLNGCSTDNVPGVHGWGDAKIRNLFKQCNFKGKAILKTISELGLDKQFNSSLKLIILPYNMDLDIPISHVSSKVIVNRKALIKLLFKYNVFSIDPVEFLA